MGIFDRIFANLAAESGPPDSVMIDSTHLKAHRTAADIVAFLKTLTVKLQGTPLDQVPAEPSL
jgi:hypothetical protein